jgi:hypothetical protein
MLLLLLFELSQYHPALRFKSLYASADGALVFPVLSLPGKSARGLLALSDLNSWTQDRRVSTISISSGGGFSFSAGGDVPALISRTFIVLLPFSRDGVSEGWVCGFRLGAGILAVLL